MYRAIIFDMDDTLIQTRKVKYKAHKHAAKKFYNLKLTNADLNRHWGKPFEQLMGDLYGAVDPLGKVLDNYYSIGHLFPLSAHDHAVEVVTQLSRKFLTGLLTAANTRLMLSSLREAGIDSQLFSYIQTSDDTLVHKPDPKVFDPALSFFSARGINPGEIVYVGDTLSDYYASSSAGLHFVGIAGHTIPKAQFTKVRAPTVDSLLGLIEHLSC